MRTSVYCLILLSLGAAIPARSSAQVPHTAPILAAKKTSTKVPVLFLSDIHFDPFHDPTLVPQLVAAKVKDWPKILATPTTPAAQQAYADLQKTCAARAPDTDYTLLTASLAAEHAQLAAPHFITVSGDLMAHQFDCRFKILVPKGSEADYSAFASNTIAFVAQQLHNTFPGTPIYFALGNNDSGCKDYREDSNSAYLNATALTFADTAINKTNQQNIRTSAPAYGDYSVELPAPFKHTNLLVMQNIFESKKYATCSGKDSDKETADQIDWLRKQLDDARTHHQHIWVMAHIPPGVDAYTTISRAVRGNPEDHSCAYEKPEMFLSSQLFADALRDYTDVISLVLLGHTHMDEMRLYAAKDGSSSGAIPAKLVPSISPVDGNNPAFTIGLVNPATATLIDYSVFVAGNQTGVATRWPREYNYSATYHQPDYSGASVARLTSQFLKDPHSKSPLSQSYETYFFAGGATSGMNVKAAAMSIIWPIYSCSLTNDHKKAFRDCACQAQ
jgi:sphingomyelin phosphodiesterase acid-like 3